MRFCFSEAQVNAASTSVGGGESVPQWASWALSALSSKFYKTPTTAAPAPSAAAQTNKTPASLSVAQKSPESEKKLSMERTESPAQKEENAWGEDESDWGQMDETPETKPSDNLSSPTDGWEDEPWEGIEQSFISDPYPF